MFNARCPHVPGTEQHTGCRRGSRQPGHGDTREQEGCPQVSHLPLHLSGGAAGLFQEEGVSSAGLVPSWTRGRASVPSKHVAVRGTGQRGCCPPAASAAWQPHGTGSGRCVSGHIINSARGTACEPPAPPQCTSHRQGLPRLGTAAGAHPCKWTRGRIWGGAGTTVTSVDLELWMSG